MAEQVIPAMRAFNCWENSEEFINGSKAFWDMTHYYTDRAAGRQVMGIADLVKLLE
jgi:hypothetical protein